MMSSSDKHGEALQAENVCPRLRILLQTTFEPGCRTRQCRLPRVPKQGDITKHEPRAGTQAIMIGVNATASSNVALSSVSAC